MGITTKVVYHGTGNSAEGVDGGSRLKLPMFLCLRRYWRSTFVSSLNSIQGLVRDAGFADSQHAYPHSSGAMVMYAWLNKEFDHAASDAGRSVA